MKFKSFLNRLLLLIIITILAFVFYLGWEQVNVEENSYIAIFTKTTGWKDKTINTGNFSWSLEKIIPNNYTHHKIIIRDQSLNYESNELLPSANLYASFNEIDKLNFEYNYKLTGSFKYNPSYLVTMLKNGTFTQETYNDWIQGKTDEIQNLLKTFIREKVLSEELLTVNGLAVEYLTSRYPFLNISEIHIDIQKPDMTLYTLSRNKYIQNMEAQSKADDAYLVESLQQKNREILRLDLLKQYGEVFTKYPIMIEYLKIDSNMTLDRANINDFISQ